MLAALTDFDFIVTFTTVQFTVTHVKPQSGAADIIKAHAMVKNVVDVVSRSEAEILSSMHVNATGYDCHVHVCYSDRRCLQQQQR